MSDARESPLPKGIPKPALRALSSVGVTRLDEVPRFSKGELLALHGMGPKALGILADALDGDGLSFTDD